MPPRWGSRASFQASDWATVSKLLCDMAAAKVQKALPNPADRFLVLKP